MPKKMQDLNVSHLKGERMSLVNTLMLLVANFTRKFRLQGVVTQIEPYGEIYQTIGQCILSNCNPAANKQYVNKARVEQTCLYKLCQAVS